MAWLSLLVLVVLPQLRDQRCFLTTSCVFLCVVYSMYMYVCIVLSLKVRSFVGVCVFLGVCVCIFCVCVYCMCVDFWV